MVKYLLVLLSASCLLPMENLEDLKSALQEDENAQIRDFLMAGSNTSKAQMLRLYKLGIVSKKYLEYPK